MTMTKGVYVIQSVSNEDDFWSNEFGWVERESATEFTIAEHNTLNLPDEGAWLWEPPHIELEQVKDLEDLRARARGHVVRVRLALNGGAYSRKSITWHNSTDGGRWYVTNHIDDTKQTLTDEQLWSESNIGKWLDGGAVWVEA